MKLSYLVRELYPVRLEMPDGVSADDVEITRISTD